MEGIDFQAVVHADPALVLLVRPDGRILAANPAAHAELAGIRAGDAGSLFDIALDPPDAVRAYLRRCSATREGMPGALTLKSADGNLQRLRCDGALVKPASGAEPATLILRCRESLSAHQRFVTLTDRIAELNSELHLRAIAERELEAALAEKEALLHEVHHRVRNNLQVILSLLSVAANRQTDERVRETLIEAANRIQTMAIVQNLLYESGQLSVVQTADLLSALCENIRRTYNVPNVEVHVDVAPVTISLETATPLGLLVTELLSNALKHAFPGGRPGTVRVGLSAAADGALTLTVSDDGCGMPARVAEHGLGLRLIQGLAAQLAADLTVRSNPGTRYTLVFRDTFRKEARGAGEA